MQSSMDMPVLIQGGMPPPPIPTRASTREKSMTACPLARAPSMSAGEAVWT